MTDLENDLGDWPEDELEYLDQCPVCGRNESKLLYEGVTDRVFFSAPGKWTLYQCKGCGSAYLNPRPTPASIGLAYQSYFTHEESEDLVPHGGLRRLKRSLRNGYLNSCYKASLEPSNKLGAWLIPMLPQRRRIDESVRHLPSHNESKRVLNIGCGNGHFLKTAIQLGWEAWGIDLDEKAVEVARRTGANVSVGGFPDTGLPSESFDYITLNHVIEHVHSPLDALKEVYRLLKPGGKIWIATPNINSIGHCIFGRHWLNLDPPRHLVIFNINSLHDILRLAGFGAIHSIYSVTPSRGVYEASFRINIGLDPFEEVGSDLPIIFHFRSMIEDFLAKIKPIVGEQLMVISRREKL
ncbi:class I SAM-dependent methyltransferase [Acidithiobacillus sp. IBUN Pt1247-S3]|uniref:class I SAM-dependent methyltransferase n=1 Tax=Acidithiobacillus sp. IBUN Pt1247-S3 TaxID=3166642 RepID=UPI0034E41057